MTILAFLKTGVLQNQKRHQRKSKIVTILQNIWDDAGVREAIHSCPSNAAELPHDTAKCATIP